MFQPSQIRIYLTHNTEHNTLTFLIPIQHPPTEQGSVHTTIKMTENSVLRGLYTIIANFFYTVRKLALTNARRGEDHIAAYQIEQALKKYDKKKNCYSRQSEAADPESLQSLLNTILSIPNSTHQISHLITNFSPKIFFETSVDLLSSSTLKTINISHGHTKNPYLQLAHTLSMRALQQQSIVPTEAGISEQQETNGTLSSSSVFSGVEHRTVPKPRLLLHICCAPDLTRPLHRLKNYFHLSLFRYNPNIHPRKEHDKRYAQFIKLTGLEEGDYDILEDRYDPKEFFDSFYTMRTIIDKTRKNKSADQVLQASARMPERSKRCNPCYANRLEVAARNAAQHQIPFFTSTLLISPKKDAQKLFDYGVAGENKYPDTKFLRFDFAKNNGHHEAIRLTNKHELWRQNYCGCGRTIPQFNKNKVAKNKNDFKHVG